MTTTAPTKATGAAGAAHTRGDQTSRFSDILVCHIYFVFSFRAAEARKAPRLTSLWPEWNEADVNAESWDAGSGKKKETGAGKARADTKSASSVVKKCKTIGNEKEFLLLLSGPTWI